MANRDTIIKELGRFFKVAELVCDHTHAKWGEKAWQFLDTDYLRALLIIRRDILQAPMTCNHSGAHQRGLRCNRCELVREKAGVYLSSHILGKAGDFTIQGMTAEEARTKIKQNERLLPCQIRMEADVNWLHLDVLPQTGVTQKIYEFKA